MAKFRFCSFSVFLSFSVSVSLSPFHQELSSVPVKEDTPILAGCHPSSGAACRA